VFERRNSRNGGGVSSGRPNDASRGRHGKKRLKEDRWQGEGGRKKSALLEFDEGKRAVFLQYGEKKAGYCVFVVILTDEEKGDGGLRTRGGGGRISLREGRETLNVIGGEKRNQPQRSCLTGGGGVQSRERKGTSIEKKRL